MNGASSPLSRAYVRLRAEPVVHFFLIGVVLFALHRLVVGDPRIIVVTAGLKAELARRFEDLHGQPPTPAELDAELRQWERDEAAFREALRQGLDRDDPGVRASLVTKMHAIAAAEVPERQPSDEELDRWLAAHRERYEAPARYDFEFFELPTSDASAPAERERLERALRDGAIPSSLGHPIYGGTLTSADMQGRIPPQLASRIPSLPVGQWQAIDDDEKLILARVKRVEGGLPSREVLRARLVADWTSSTQQEAVDRILQRNLDRYRIEERP